MLFSFFHNFVKIKLVILFSRLISFFPIFNRVNFRRGWGLRGGWGYVRGVRRGLGGGTLGGWWYVRGYVVGWGYVGGGGAYVGGEGVRWRGGGGWYVGAGGGYVEAGGLYVGAGG